MKKIFIIALACLIALLGCTACVPQPQSTATPNVTEPTQGSQEPTVEPTLNTEPTPKPAPTTVDSQLQYSFTLADMTIPMWQSTTMYNECVTFHKDDATGEISGRLLFKPIQVISAKDNSLTIDLVEGVHYKFDETNPQKLIWLEGDDNFVIPYFTKNDVEGKNPDGTYIPEYPTWTDGKSRFGNMLYCVSEFLYEKQLAFTYTYDINENEVPHVEYSGDSLPKTMNILKNGQELNLFIYGDSIFTGCDSSKLYHREPNTPQFFFLLRDQLEEFYPNCNVKIKNPSVGGWGAKDGIANVHAKVTEKNPDLVVLGFGMNDSGTSGTEEAKSIKIMIDDIRAENPDCEFIVVSTFCANSNWDNLQRTHAAGFKTLEEEGIATMDMHALHSYLLARKSYQDCTGNNVNHPNDWLARMYTWQLLTMLYDYNAVK